MEHRLIRDGDLVLYGTVGVMGWFFDEGFTAADVVNALEDMDGDLTIRLNSGGGLADEGVAINNVLRRYAEKHGEVTVVVDGIAASAASVLAMGADHLVMPVGTTLMIHEGSMLTMGTADDHEKSVTQLRHVNDQIAAIYADRSGRPKSEMLALMAAETWLSGDEAVDLGLATATDTKISSAKPAAFNYLMYKNAPPKLKTMARKLLGPDKVAAFEGLSNRRHGTMTRTAADTTAAPATTTDQPAPAPAPAPVPAPADLAAASAQGATAARERIRAIMALPEAVGRRVQAEAMALETDLTPEAAAKVLAKSPQDGAAPATHQDSAFYRALASSGADPQVPAGGNAGGTGADQAQAVKAIWKRAVDKHNARVERKLQ